MPSIYRTEPRTPGKKAPRHLTARDVEVLRAVADLRSKGMNTDEVNAQLTGKSFAVVVDDDDDDAKDDSPDDNIAHFDIQPATQPQAWARPSPQVGRGEPCRICYPPAT